jgi:hypothetical protein
MCLKRCKMRRGWWGDPPNVPTNWEWTEKQTIFLFLCCLFTQARHRSGGKNWVLWLSSTQGTYSLFSSCQENLFCLISLGHAVILCVASLPHAAVARASVLDPRIVPPPHTCRRPHRAQGFSPVPMFRSPVKATSFFDGAQWKPNPE